MTKIMIVDDSLITLKILKDAFNEYGLNVDVVSAKDGAEAVEKYAAENPDLVFMDITMPNEDGLSSLKDIISKYPDAKIVMATSIAEAATRQEALQAGAKDYITKPFEKNDIKRILKEQLEIIM
jgi:two-component system, chemotaxis family, chemotaxis protein CheY